MRGIASFDASYMYCVYMYNFPDRQLKVCFLFGRHDELNFFFFFSFRVSKSVLDASAFRADRFVILFRLRSLGCGYFQQIGQEHHVFEAGLSP